MDEVLENSVSDWSTYNPGSHREIKKIIQDNINSVCANYVAIGFYLNVVNDRKLYEEDGYSGIGEYAAAEYGIQKDRCSWLMKIADRFCIENSPALKPEYRDFSISKLREMVYLDDKQLEQVTVTSTISEIRDIKKPKKQKVATSQLEQEPVTNKSEIVNDMDETVIDTSEFAIKEPETVIETVEADIIQAEQELKQTEISKPKTPILKGLMDYPYCPECGTDLIYKCDCLKCGCKIDWEPVKGLFEFEEEQLQRKLAERNQLNVEPQEQPELPILKNNNQRKAFIEAYETWPIWIDLPQTGERYYRYDLTDKVALVVKVSQRHIWENYKETQEIGYTSPQYYLLGIRTTYSTKVTYQEDPSRTFYECSSNMTDMVNYLKEFQKK